MNKLATIRKDADMSQEKLAALSGVHRVTIARIETGKISPTVGTLVKLAKALDVDVSELIEGA